ncbi:hypothetical protein DPMN_114524 [Dreissena polymorpha]|uniref:Uncharacterized protein n=1 Tax=Dreissena polymorpha TaxID=45954 RepID=A0A9D4QRM5_DREPO|nr:hypothetical protein DPMN_114524 [Dreissena polymorpha]
MEIRVFKGLYSAFGDRVQCRGLAFVQQDGDYVGLVESVLGGEAEEDYSPQPGLAIAAAAMTILN